LRRINFFCIFIGLIQFYIQAISPTYKFLSGGVWITRVCSGTDLLRIAITHPVYILVLSWFHSSEGRRK
jgi:hypothetical protein